MNELNIEYIANEIKQRAQEAANEEDLKIGFAVVIDPIIRSWNIKPHYEKYTTGVRCVVSGVRKDALYGTVIIEFKAPGKLKSSKEFQKAKDQIKGYINTEAVSPEYYGRYFGVIIDGFKIAFIRFRKKEWEETEALEINAETILRLLEAIRGLKRKPIEAKLLLEDFGPQSSITKDSILTLYTALINSKSPRTKMLFEDWKRVFSQVCAYSSEKLEGLIDYYRLKNYKGIDVEKLMFSIHTYYTLLMKLLTSEVVTLFTDTLIGSYLKLLEETYLKNKSDMLFELRKLEEGGIFAQLGIKNFLEADYFAWYLDEWNDEIASIIYNITKKLLDYEPATVELSPEKIKDLFKRLYQNLVPRDIRHKLGEYFTPDWLAELLLDEVGYDGNPEKKILDPTCGSGTFLVLAIKRIKEYAEEHFLDKRELLTKIVKNVQGIDLNPLAVIASKANYIIAIADLLRYRPREGIELPIYLADSIAVGRRSHVYQEVVYLKTVVSEFYIPLEVLDKGLLSKVLDDIDYCIRTKYSKEEFKKFIQKYGLNEYTIESLTKLYSDLASLEEEGKNRIWTKVLKNSFAPLLIGEFDYVVGNPPWINWDNLPEAYRNDTKPLWDEYGLLEKTKGGGLGKVKRDMAMFFVARCLNKFLKDTGRLSFLIPFTVYKTQAGAGFRKFLTNRCKVLRIHDLVTLCPFEGAVNRTSLLVIEKTGKTEFPIPCITWSNPKSKGIDQEVELEEVKKTTKQFDLFSLPIEKNRPESPWMQITEKAYEGIKKVFGSSPWYKAHAGVYTGLNQVYWIKIISETLDGVLIENPPIPGQKKKVRQVKQVVEKDLVYPLVRGRDVKKWYVESELGYILLPVDNNGVTLSHSDLKVKYSKTWEYFSNFFEDLVNRGGEPYKSKLEPYRKEKFEVAEKSAPPFYWLFNVKPSLAPYKVVWKRIAGAITGKAVSFASAVIEPYGGRAVILNDSLILIPFNNKEEAYYVAGILNSSIALLAIASYTYELRQETHITQYIRIPQFNKNEEKHIRISTLSEKAHTFGKQIYEELDDLRDKLRNIEEEIDKNVAELYGISDEELKEIKKCLMILKEGEVQEEEEAEEEITLPKEEGMKLSLEPLLINESQSQEINVKLTNNFDFDVKDLKLKISLKDIVIEKEVEKIEKGEEKVLKFSCPKLKTGQYTLKIKIAFSVNGQKKVIEEERTLFVKTINRRESSGFEDLDKLIGD
ncbi:MAG: N-6 DNA methylase [Candidatus Nitrosocaldus sp.]